jgi:hypothetical protein
VAALTRAGSVRLDQGRVDRQQPGAEAAGPARAAGVPAQAEIQPAAADQIDDRGLFGHVQRRT